MGKANKLATKGPPSVNRLFLNIFVLSPIHLPFGNHSPEKITKSLIAILTVVFLFGSQDAFAQSNNVDDKKEKDTIASMFNSLMFRSIGPAVTSGRVIDFAVNPAD